MGTSLRKLICLVGFIQVLLLLVYYVPSISTMASNQVPGINYSPNLQKWYFLHFHKAAGTSLCGVIRNSPASLVVSHTQHTHNCNSLPKVTRIDHIKKTEVIVSNNTVSKKTDMCPLLLQEYENKHINIVGRETWFDSDAYDNVCPNINYITIIREPISRIISHLQFESQYASKILKWLKKGKEHDYFYRQSSKHVGTFVIDNFYIRMLLYDELFFAPLYSITEEHYHRAKKILKQFKLVIPLSKWDEGMNILGDKYNWNIDVLDEEDSCPVCDRIDKYEIPLRHMTDKHRKWRWNTYACSHHEELQLKQELNNLNHWDIKLYEWIETYLFPLQVSLL